MQKKILIIGALPHPDDLKTYGGTTTLMKNFLDYCDEHSYPYIHIDTFKYKNKVLNALYFLLSFVYGLCVCPIVMYNASVNGAFTIFYHTAPIAFFFKKKVVFRKFAGGFNEQLERRKGGKAERMIYLLNKTDIVYFETKNLMNEMPKILSNPSRIHWFPNCRKLSMLANEKRPFGKRFVFISLMLEEKGVDLLLNVADKLSSEYTVHLFGGIKSEKYADLNYFEGRKAQYKGALKTEEVLPNLANYDVLVLPTYWATEGYPGIIIEAMSLGKPIISTNIGGIPELIENGINGFLIPPKDEDALYDAIMSFDAVNHAKMSEIALAYFNKNYKSEVINDKVYREMISLL